MFLSLGLNRDENLPLFRGFPLFFLKIVETKSFCFEPMCPNLVSFENRGRGVSSFLVDFLFFLKKKKKPCCHPSILVKAIKQRMFFFKLL